MSNALDVRKKSDIPKLAELIKRGPTTLVLIYADWCGYCTRYKPTWETFEKLPNRRANIASIHHDMVDEFPLLSSARITGYPSVVKISADGALTEYTDESGNKTNAMPNIRDIDIMTREFVAISGGSRRKSKKRQTYKHPRILGGADKNIYNIPGLQYGVVSSGNTITKTEMMQRGGSLITPLIGAIQTVGPATLLLSAYSLLPKKSRTRKNRE
jgi:thiol-disulfide isomerase/thioredoxin